MGWVAGLTTRTWKKPIVKKSQQKETQFNRQKTFYGPTARTKDMRSRIGTWNVRTLKQPGSLLSLINSMEKYRLELVALQEVRWPGNGIHESQGYTLFYSGGDTANRGTGFLVGPQVKKAVLNFKAVSDRMCMLRLRMRFTNLSIISVHAPTEESQSSDKDKFYDQLDILLNSLPGHDIRMVIGDFNAKAGKDQAKICRSIGPYSRHETANDNGGRMMYFASANDLVVASTFFPHKRIHLETWISPSGKTRNQIDHIMISAQKFPIISDVRTFRSATIGSDHYLVVAMFKWRFPSFKRRQKQRLVRYNIESLKDDNIRETYEDLVSDSLRSSNNQSGDVNSDWDALKISVVNAAHQALGEEVRSRQADPWFDDECRDAVNRRNEAHCHMKERFTSSRKAQFIRQRNLAKSVCKRKKREWWRSKVERVQELSNGRNTRDFFKRVKELHTTSQPKVSAIRDLGGSLHVDIDAVLESWTEYFESLLNIQHDLETVTDIPQLQTAEIFVENPSYEEFTLAMRKLKNNRAPGIDRINSELIIFGGEVLWNRLFELIQKVWSSETMPDEWRLAVLCPIYKKGDRLKCENYRGIALLCTAYKVLSYILLERIIPISESIIGDYQCGFRPNRSVTDQVFSVRMILSKYWEYGKSVHQIFLDFKQAYDSINRESLWFALEFLGIPRKLVALCRMTVAQSQCCVKVENGISRCFEVNSGVRQGDALSPMLFNLMLEYVFRKSETPQRNMLYNQSNQVMAYADDICIIGLRKDAINDILNPLLIVANTVGLNINQSKTKYMITGRTTSTESLISGGLNFEGVGMFKYLGSMITQTNDVTEDINIRLVAANRALFSLRLLMRSKYLSTATKLHMYKILIRPVAIYGCESWTLTSESERLLMTFERKIMRMIFGPRRNDDGTFRVLYNHEIRDLFQDSDIVGEIKSQRIRWLGHVLRADPQRSVWRALFRTPEGVRRRGRPRLRWLEDVEKDLAAVDCLSGWRSQALDRHLWSQTVDRVGTIRGPL